MDIQKQEEAKSQNIIVKGVNVKGISPAVAGNKKMTIYKQTKLNKTNYKLIALEVTVAIFFGASFVTAMWFAPLIAGLIR